MPLLSDVVAIFLCWTVVLTQNGQFVDCANIAFSEWYYCQMHGEGEPKILRWIKEINIFMSWNIHSVRLVLLHYTTQHNKLFSDSGLVRQLVAGCTSNRHSTILSEPRGWPYVSPCSECRSWHFCMSCSLCAWPLCIPTAQSISLPSFLSSASSLVPLPIAKPCLLPHTVSKS